MSSGVGLHMRFFGLRIGPHLSDIRSGTLFWIQTVALTGAPHNECFNDEPAEWVGEQQVLIRLGLGLDEGARLVAVCREGLKQRVSRIIPIKRR